ncbi:transposase [Acidisoma cellulosilytica]|uniref:Transposase n=1 Tax=Acidisoma cellulosilyticum TaxID=2802395 RepID=A0A963Z830_9PROT|nr:transposase [Acidisoma cellulosilyticum]
MPRPPPLGRRRTLLEIGETTPLARFATSLRRDVNAIKNAPATPWTTSPVEGQINKLKMIKRTMHGRAGFQLLRARILHSIASRSARFMRKNSKLGAPTPPWPG